MSNAQSYDIKVILGDLNAKVIRENWTKQTCGIYGQREESNDYGTRLNNFAFHRRMIIRGTMFTQKNILKGWRNNQSDRSYTD